MLGVEHPMFLQDKCRNTDSWLVHTDRANDTTLSMERTLCTHTMHIKVSNVSIMLSLDPAYGSSSQGSVAAGLIVVKPAYDKCEREHLRVEFAV
jgi:hypothetical protein